MTHARRATLACLLSLGVLAGAAQAADSKPLAPPAPIVPSAPTPAAAPKLPSQAQTELERMLKAIEKLKDDYGTKALAELEKGRLALKKALVAATRAGDTEGVQAIQAKLAELETTALLRIGGDDGGDPFGPQEPVLGLWKSAGMEYLFKSGGEMVLTGHAPHAEKGTWKAQGANAYQITWPWGIDRLVLDSQNEGKLSWGDNSSHPFTRVK